MKLLESAVPVRRRATATIVIAASALVLAAPPAAAAGPPSLAGTSLTAYDEQLEFVAGGCEAGAQWTFRARGRAWPPYDGTFVETGTLTLGAAGGGLTVTAVDTTFRVESRAGAVAFGAKTLATRPLGIYCATDPVDFLALAALRYSAVTLGFGSWCAEHGNAHLSLSLRDVGARPHARSHWFIGSFDAAVRWCAS